MSPAPTNPSPEQLALLTPIAEAAEQRREWERVYLGAIHDAHDAGCTATMIAQFTGTSYQSVQQIIKRGRRP